MSELVKSINDSNFEEEVINSEIPVLVDFWASWCEPCKAMAPVIDELAEDFKGKVAFVKINVEENKKFAAKYKVRGLPNFLLFQGEETKGQIVGFVSKQEIEKIINEIL